MRKCKKTSENAEMRAEYTRADLGKLTRGKFHNQVTASSNVVILDSAVAKEFPNSVAVNKALKAIISNAKLRKVSKQVAARTKKPVKLQRAAKR